MDSLPPASPAAEGGAAVSLPVSAGQAPLAIRANPMLGSYAATVCVIVHDEMFFLPAFLAHYRRLGADRFIVLDDRSTDGTRAFLAGEPDVMVVEELFFFKNANTAIPVAQARGVIMLAAAQAGVPVVSYTPMQVKKTVTGTGKAEKIEVQEAIRDLLGLESIPRPDDAADALSLAMTHWQHLEGIGETSKVSHLGAGGGRG